LQTTRILQTALLQTTLSVADYSNTLAASQATDLANNLRTGHFWWLNLQRLPQ